MPHAISALPASSQLLFMLMAVRYTWPVLPSDRKKLPCPRMPASPNAQLRREEDCYIHQVRAISQGIGLLGHFIGRLPGKCLPSLTSSARFPTQPARNAAPGPFPAPVQACCDARLRHQRPGGHPHGPLLCRVSARACTRAPGDVLRAYVHIHAYLCACGASRLASRCFPSVHSF